ncbi:uncharacterized protein LOC108864649 [Galendromus occidentalis]|uniref:Uncharacterized protein LOC108864649 n=1 Tax=Galendromus occidentalis TaxID=34638 RepID=A0AAJ7L5D5_9ACAR|nr:uncharacterized protein LOC108864649 [Galendromus occidentalis]
MRSFIILSAIVACVFAGPLQPGRSYRSENEKGNYAFGYASEGGSFHQETGSPGVKIGSYGVKQPDGSERVVNYVADENGFRASVEVKDPDSVAPVDLLVAQAHPVAVTTVTSPSEPVKIEEKTEAADKTIRRVDEASVDQSLQSVDQVTDITEKEPAVPRPVQQVEGVLVQPQMPAHQLEGSVPKPQDFPATVFFVPLPQQVAYSRVQSYSVHGFVPVPIVPYRQVPKVPSYQSPLQIPGVRDQIPQVPPQVLTWQYLARPLPAVSQQLSPYQQIQSYMPMVL